jgi:hypothetical protein
MIFRVKNGIIFVIIAVVGIVGNYGYYYFFDDAAPTISLTGLENNQHCAGDVPCSVACNKSGDISVWLDGQLLLNKFSINTGNHNYAFTIPTQNMTRGEHLLHAEFTEKTFAKKSTALDRSFNVDNTPLQAAFVRPDTDYKVFQGRTFHIQFQVNKPLKEAKINTLSSTYNCFPESNNSLIYESFIPISCDQQPNEYLVGIEITDFVGNTLHLDNKLQIVVFPFKTQAIQIGKEKVQEEKKLGLSIADRERIIAELSEKSCPKKLWTGSFCTPVDITKVTCDFGTIRTTQEKGRYKHCALDVLSAPKSVIWSTQDGVVVLKERFEDAGNTIIVDHGHGLLSLFYHLDDFANIEVGQKIAQGNPIGFLGKTGYATGYHLHWEMRMNNTAIDPMQWTKSNF